MTTIARFMPVPPTAVWAALADAGSYGYWVVGSKLIRDADPDWPAVGSRFHHTIGFGPFTVEDHTEAIESEPGRRLVLRAKGRPVLTARVTLDLHPEDGGTRVEMAERPERRVRAAGPQPTGPPRHPLAEHGVADAAGGTRDAAHGMTSLWLDTAPPGRPYPEADAPGDADVIVIGAGITGITTALRLQEAGARTILLEAGRIASGVSGQTTAKVTTQHGLVYADLTDAHGADAARRYAVANERALDWIADRVADRAIDSAGAGRTPTPTSRARMRAASSRPRRRRLRGRAARHRDRRHPLRYPVAAALRFDDEAELARRASCPPRRTARRGGRQVHGRTRAVEVSEDERLAVKTLGRAADRGSCDRRHHVRFLDPSPAFARATRALVPVACRIGAIRCGGCTERGRPGARCGGCRGRLRGAARRRRGRRDGGRGGDGEPSTARGVRPIALGRRGGHARSSSRSAIPLDGRLPLVRTRLRRAAGAGCCSPPAPPSGG